MKIGCILFLACFFLLLPLSVFSQWLTEPESIVYDPGSDSYIVSNCGDGSITRIDSEGNQSFFSYELMGSYIVLGLKIHEETLLAATAEGPGMGLAGFNLESGELLFHIEVPGGALPNDLTVDNNGIIYLTDCEADRIYRFIDLQPEIYFEGLNYVNGIFYDEDNHSLLVGTSAPPYRILEIDIADSTITTVAEPEIGIIDGLVMDSERNIYYSSWATHSIYKYEGGFTNPPVLFSADHPGPADIFINEEENLLCIPCYDANRIDYVPLNQTEVKEETQNPFLPQQIKLSNYPNPFNPNTTITFGIEKTGNVVLDVYDINGRLVKQLFSGIAHAGSNTINFNASSLSSGNYFVKLSGENCQNTIQIQLLK